MAAPQFLAGQVTVPEEFLSNAQDGQGRAVEALRRQQRRQAAERLHAPNRCVRNDARWHHRWHHSLPSGDVDLSAALFEHASARVIVAEQRISLSITQRVTKPDKPLCYKGKHGAPRRI